MTQQSPFTVFSRKRLTLRAAGHPAASVALAWALAAAPSLVATAAAQAVTEWRGGSGLWSAPGNWSTGNTPDAPREQARHPANAGAETITFDLPQPTKIHSFIGFPSAAQHLLQLAPGASLSMNFIDGQVDSATPYRIEIESGATLVTARSAGPGLQWTIAPGGNATIGTHALGGEWTIGDISADNRGTSVFVGGDIRGGVWTVHRGANLGTQGARVAGIRNASLRLGADNGPGTPASGGGRVYVAGDIENTAITSSRELAKHFPPCILDVAGALVDSTVDLHISGAFNCVDTTEHPQYSFAHLVNTTGTIINADIIVGPDATFVGGGVFFDDVVFYGKLEQVIDGRWDFHHVRRYRELGNEPTDPGLHLGRFVSATPGLPDVAVRPGWIMLGPGPSQVDELLLGGDGQAACGHSPAAIDAHEEGFDLQVRDLRIEAGHVNRAHAAGALRSRLSIGERLDANPAATPGFTAFLRLGQLELARSAHLRVTREATSLSVLRVQIQGALQIESVIAASPWEARGAILATERNPAQPDGPPPAIEIEVLNTDWGGHWFCDVAGAAANGDPDPRVKPWGGFTVGGGTVAVLVDQHSTSVSLPNDDHGAAPLAHPAEALFVDGVVAVEPGGILDLNGLNLYTTQAPLVHGLVIGGDVIEIRPRPFGTFDEDADVDEADRAILLAAMSGSGVPSGNPLCDADGDRDVDAADLAAFEANFTGAGIPADCD